MVALLARLALLCTLAAATYSGPDQHFSLPAQVVEGGIALPQKVGSQPFDTVYSSKPNGTTFESWYFDAVTDDARHAVVLLFDVNYFSSEHIITNMQFVLENVTLLEFSLHQSTFQVTTHGNGSSLNYGNGLFSWKGLATIDRYAFHFNVPESGVSGSIRYKSTAPAHTGCSRNTVGASLLYNSPGMYWTTPSRILLQALT